MNAKEHFIDAHNTLNEFISEESNFDLIENAIDALAECFNQEGKVISCGNGGSHCDAMHFAEELTGRYRNNRKALPAIAISDSSHITCVGNDLAMTIYFLDSLRHMEKKAMFYWVFLLVEIART